MLLCMSCLLETRVLLERSTNFTHPNKCDLHIQCMSQIVPYSLHSEQLLPRALVKSSALYRACGAVRDPDNVSEVEFKMSVVWTSRSNMTISHRLVSVFSNIRQICVCRCLRTCMRVQLSMLWSVRQPFWHWTISLICLHGDDVDHWLAIVYFLGNRLYLVRVLYSNQQL